MTEGQDRNLDFAPVASIDKVALNNKVIKMRADVKRAKLYVINDLTRKAKKWRSKKGSEDQKKKNSEKADRLIEEVKVIKILKKDYVSKYALGATEKFQTLIAKPTTSMEQRALARLSENKFILEKVTEFRNGHTDWKELAAFLMTKNTSREFNKKKKPKKKPKKVETNVNASETLIHAYLGGKLSSIRSELKDEEEKMNREMETKLFQDPDEEVESESEDEAELSNDENVTSDEDENDSNEDKVGAVLGISNDDEEDDDFEIPTVYTKEDRDVGDSSEESSESEEDDGGNKIPKKNLGDAIRLLAQQKKANKTLLEKKKIKLETKSTKKSEKQKLSLNKNVKGVSNETVNEKSVLKSVSAKDFKDKKEMESKISLKNSKTDRNESKIQCDKNTSNLRDVVTKQLSSDDDDDDDDDDNDDDEEEEDHDDDDNEEEDNYDSDDDDEEEEEDDYNDNEEAMKEVDDSDSGEEDEEVGYSDESDDIVRESNQAKQIKKSAKKSVTLREKTHGEMIIKRIDLSKDLETEEIPAILTNKQEKIARTGKRTVKDEFFACSDSEGNDGDEMVNDTKGDNFEEMEEEEHDGPEATRLDLNSFSTTFVGSLSSEKMMECTEKQFRTNQEWKKLRQEKFSRGGQDSSRGHFGSGGRGTFREQSDASSRRGRGGFGARGRGQSQEEGFSRGPRGRGESGRGGMQGESFGRDRGFHAGGRGSDRGRGAAGSSRPWMAGAKTGSQPSEKLHPSWEASKKRKQQQNTIAAFEGKKVKFDE